MKPSSQNELEMNAQRISALLGTGKEKVFSGYHERFDVSFCVIVVCALKRHNLSVGKNPTRKLLFQPEALKDGFWRTQKD